MPITGKQIESAQIAFTTGPATSVTFRVGLVSTNMTRITLACDADCFINFDDVADNTCFVLQAGCPTVLDTCNFTTLSVLGASSGGTLYILAQRA